MDTHHDAGHPRRNVAWKMTGKETFELEERAVPHTCGPYEAIVCPKRNGICGSDMHVWLDDSGGGPFENPLVLGHECSAVIYKVGDKVTSLTPGDRVALEPGAACLRCHACKTGNYAHCPEMRFAASRGIDGTLQGYYTLPAELCYKLPDSMSLDEGALMEPLAVAVNAVSAVAQLRPGSNVMVFGTGPVGILVIGVCKAFGAKRIIAVDVQQARLDFVASHFGIETHLASPAEPDEKREDYSRRHAELIRAKFDLPDHGPAGIDTVFECSGAEVCVQTGLWVSKRQGHFIQVGNGALYNNIPLLTVTDRALTIKGCFRYGAGAFETGIDLVARGLLDVKPLISHRFPFQQAADAFDSAKVGKGPDGKQTVKVIIEGLRC